MASQGLKLGKYSIGTGDRFAHQAQAPQNTPAAAPATAPAPERKASNADAGPSSSVDAGHPDVALQANSSANPTPPKPGAPAANRPVKPSNTPAPARQPPIATRACAIEDSRLPDAPDRRISLPRAGEQSTSPRAAARRNPR